MSIPDPAQAGTAGTSPREDPWAIWMPGILQHEDSALAALYDASSSVVFGLALRMLGDRNDAEEVALDVYKYVWRSAGAFDGARGTVAAWLIMLVRSRCVDRIRFRESRERAEETARQPRTVPPPDPVVAQQAAEIRHALECLPPEQAELIDLAYFSGFSHSELAERTGLPLGTIKTRLRLGLGRLRDLLKDWKP
jgi:RNA polymerase sigma-70 factor (ECF subfamily)